MKFKNVCHDRYHDIFSNTYLTGESFKGHLCFHIFFSLSLRDKVTGVLAAVQSWNTWDSGGGACAQGARHYIMRQRSTYCNVQQRVVPIVKSLFCWLDPVKPMQHLIHCGQTIPSPCSMWLMSDALLWNRNDSQQQYIIGVSLQSAPWVWSQAGRKRSFYPNNWLGLTQVVHKDLVS
jgi:hypothetical protein